MINISVDERRFISHHSTSIEGSKPSIVLTNDVVELKSVVSLVATSWHYVQSTLLFLDITDHIYFIFLQPVANIKKTMVLQFV